MSHMRTIEVGGHKFEVDLRTAKKIDTFKVGDRVKVLIKAYSGYETHPGFIVGIDAFQNLPTIVVAYIQSVFRDTGEVCFAYLNSQTKETEICHMAEDDVMPNTETIKTMFDRAIAKKTQEANDIRDRKEYFLRQFGTTFGVGREALASTETQ